MSSSVDILEVYAQTVVERTGYRTDVDEGFLLVVSFNTNPTRRLGFNDGRWRNGKVQSPRHCTTCNGSGHNRARCPRRFDSYKEKE
jgi:hypothetical protein